jgi:hypothetical protein
MKIDFDRNVVIGCIPKSVMRIAPHDQPGCKIEKCPSCKQDIWVSTLKKEASTKPNSILCCWICIVKEQIRQGINPGDCDFIRLNARH